MPRPWSISLEQWFCSFSAQRLREAREYSTAQSHRGPLIFALISRPSRSRQALSSQMLTRGCCLVNVAPQPVLILRRRSPLRISVALVPCCGRLLPYRCRSSSLTYNEAHTRILQRLISTAQACNSTTARASLQQAHHQCNELQHGPHQPVESSTLQNATTDVQPSVRPGGFPVSQLLARSLLVAGMLMLTSHFGEYRSRALCLIVLMISRCLTRLWTAPLCMSVLFAA